MCFTHVSASVADFRAFLADVMMMRRQAAHEICRKSAKLSAIQKSYQMLRLRMVSTVVKHVCNRCGANLMTLETDSDAIRVQIGVCVFHDFL
jgi:ribosomal protein L40E